MTHVDAKGKSPRRQRVKRDSIQPGENPKPGDVPYKFALTDSSEHAPTAKHDVYATNLLYKQRCFLPETYIDKLVEDHRTAKPVIEEDKTCCICLCEMEETRNTR